ncbi:hypothetical protein NHH03_14170 [Stieleria sp. TO1_6]|uniref:hypothetical protein n=1 Tax=Stieleria tagensis TaxID=2956795 RepID=UPI00209B3175|nr:hypothetical protein [Stieleria tagensis]MCO8122890.1 hypothetical protein [Stieleria tagensis]
MTQETNNQPADTIRYGLLKGVIWSNPGKDGKPNRYTVNYVRSYKNPDGHWKDTTSLSEIDNLKLSYLVPKVVERIIELKSSDATADAEE